MVKQQNKYSYQSFNHMMTITSRKKYIQSSFVKDQKWIEE